MICTALIAKFCTCGQSHSALDGGQDLQLRLRDPLVANGLAVVLGVRVRCQDDLGVERLLGNLEPSFLPLVPRATAVSGCRS